MKAVAEDFATAEGRTAARSALQTRFTGGKLEGLKDAALAELRTISSTLDAKAPEDAAAFKAWLQEVAQKAAEAGTEGGFLGFGGVAVSEAEKATVAEISVALNRGAEQHRPVGERREHYLDHRHRFCCGRDRKAHYAGK